MSEVEQKFARELARLSDAFVDELPLRVQSVSEDMSAWLSAPDEEALLERLRHKVHQLKGAGSTFGCPGISAAAGGSRCLKCTTLPNTRWKFWRLTNSSF